jgi:hypothetical protein
LAVFSLIFGLFSKKNKELPYKVLNNKQNSQKPVSLEVLQPLAMMRRQPLTAPGV